MQYLVANINDFTESELLSALSQMPINQYEYISNKNCDVSKKESIVARMLLKKMMLDFGVSDGYNITFDNRGKPYYLNSSDLHFSISHSNGYVAVAISTKPIGIDLQVFKSVNDKLVKRVCTAEEREFIKRVGDKGFIKIWTAKESYSKCAGVKLTDTYKLSFIKDGCVYGLDKNLLSISHDSYELSIIE